MSGYLRESIAKIIAPNAFRGGFLASEFERLGLGVSPKIEAYAKADQIIALWATHPASNARQDEGTVV